MINLKSDASTDSSSIGLTVTTSGAPIATLTISGGYGDGVDIPDLTSLDKTYDGSDDAAMTEYVANITGILSLQILRQPVFRMNLQHSLRLSLHQQLKA